MLLLLNSKRLGQLRLIGNSGEQPMIDGKNLSTTLVELPQQREKHQHKENLVTDSKLLVLPTSQESNEEQLTIRGSTNRIRLEQELPMLVQLLQKLHK